MIKVQVLEDKILFDAEIADEHAEKILIKNPIVGFHFESSWLDNIEKPRKYKPIKER